MNNKKILLLRHGETDWNIQRRFQGSRDTPLNGNGERQAREVSPRVRRWRPERVLSSPLRRALETALIATGLPRESVRIVPELREINFGAWEGQTAARLRENDELFRRWVHRPFGVAPSGGETEAEILGRARAVLALLESCPEERVLVVSHGGTLRALLSAALEVPLQSVWKFFRLSNCSLTGLERDGGTFVLAFYNDHLSGAGAARAGEEAALPIAF